MFSRCNIFARYTGVAVHCRCHDVSCPLGYLLVERGTRCRHVVNVSPLAPAACVETLCHTSFRLLTASASCSTWTCCLLSCTAPGVSRMDLSMLLKAQFQEEAMEDPFDSRPVDLISVRGTEHEYASCERSRLIIGNSEHAQLWRFQLR